MKLRELEASERQQTRHLWEQIFTEDTKHFLDYYYDVKTRDNQVFVVEDSDIIAMLHLNPYEVRIEDCIQKLHYIVAVATDERYRRRGIMGQLLKHVFRVMYDRKEPFTFLMPAAEAIYYPYDFRYVYSRKEGELSGEFGETDLQIRFATEEDCEELARFANAFLTDYQVVSNRTKEYYEMILKEQKSENGGIVLAYRSGELAGSFCYAKGESYEIREPLFASVKDLKSSVAVLLQGENQMIKCIDFGEEKRPIIMARILHLETFLKSLKLDADVDVFVELEDKFIEENNGVFHVVGTSKDGIQMVEKLEQVESSVKKIKMGEFTEMVFDKYLPKVFLNEVV